MVKSPTYTNLSDFFLSCDWGTSSFRLRVVSSGTGQIIAEVASKKGIKKCYERWQRSTDHSNREAYFLSVLERHIRQLRTSNSQPIEGLPLLISGMGSSSIGLRELSYCNTPVDLRQPELNIERLGTEGLSNPVYLISGICSSTDVMRGEETEILGLYARDPVPEALYLMAGTHSKHIRVEGHMLTSFKTYITGELFRLLGSHSILSDSISGDLPEEPGPPFEDGIRAAQQENMLHALFEIRARDLLADSSPTDSHSYLSGLLIGTELRDLLPDPPSQILLWGSKSLRVYYKKALEVLALPYTSISLKPNESASALGHHRLLSQILK